MSRQRFSRRARARVRGALAERLESRTLFAAGDIEFARAFTSHEAADDQANAVAAAPDGSVYTVGDTYGSLPGATHSAGVPFYRADAFVLKHDGAGNTLWTRQFGTGDYTDARGVCVDGSGNVYIVGEVSGALGGQTSAGRSDLFIRKYDSAGNELWTHQVGTAGDDYATGVASDSTGNVYLIGGSNDVLPGQSVAGPVLVKYDASGNTVWMRQFAGDQVSAVTISSAGDIYIAGEDQQNVILRRFDPSGNLVWSSGFGSSGFDSATGIACDGSSIYISGQTDGTLPGQVSLGSSDAFLARYDFSGNRIWLQQFGTASEDRATGVALHSGGPIFVSGSTTGTLPGQSSSGSSDAFIQEFGSTGATLLVRQFGTAQSESAQGVALDSSGNLYTVGQTNGSFPGFVHTVSQFNRDLFIRKYSAAGDEQWTQQTTSTTQADNGISSITTGNSIYLVGSTDGAFDYDSNSIVDTNTLFLTRCDLDGNVIWNRYFAAGALATPFKLVADADGDLYVTGIVSGAFPGFTNAGAYDSFVCKFDPEGNQLWVRQFGTPSDDLSFDIAVDSAGNSFLAGWNTLSKLDAAGNVLFTRALPGNVVSTTLTLDPSGNPLLGGRLYKQGEDEADGYLLKYDSEGNLLFTSQIGTDKDDEFYHIATDAAGNIFLAGYTYGTFPGQVKAPFGRDDSLLLKCDPAGNLLWVRQFGSTNHDIAQGIAVDGLGNPTVLTTTQPTLDDPFDFIVTQYDAAGDTLWQKTYGTAATNDDPSAIALDGAGNIFVSAAVSKYFADPSNGSYLFKLSNNSAPIASSFSTSAPEDEAFMLDLRPHALDDHTPASDLRFEITSPAPLGTLTQTDTAGVYIFEPALDSPGSVTFTWSCTDPGGLSASGSCTVNLARFRGYSISDGVLRLGGSDAADIVVSKNKDTLLFNNTAIPLAGVSEIRIYSRGGNDRIDLSDVEIPALIVGGAGNDTITGSRGSDIILGGLGDDTLESRKGDDLLIGGAGADTVTGSNGDDILIGGALAGTLGQLRDLLAGFLSTHIAALAIPVSDNNRDVITARAGQNWIVANGTDELKDYKSQQSDLLTLIA